MPFEYQVSDEIAIAIPNPKRDAEPLYKLVESSRKELGPWLPWANKMSSAKDELDFLEEVSVHAGEGKSLNLVLRYQNRPAGMISFNGFDELSHSSDVGYWLNTADTGKGIVGKALQGILKIGFEKLGLNKIIIEAAVENERSNQVAQRAGFHLDGVSRSGILLDTGFTDVNIYSILKDDWKSK